MKPYVRFARHSLLTLAALLCACGGDVAPEALSPTGARGKADSPVAPAGNAQGRTPLSSHLEMVDLSTVRVLRWQPLDNLLTAEQSQMVVDAFNAICGDTFCAGTFDYVMAAARCASAGGSCQLTYDARPHDAGQRFSATALYRTSPAALIRSGQSSAGSFIGTVVSAAERDGHVWVRSTCTLVGDYQRFEDLMAPPASSGADLTAGFYGHFIDCMRAVESILHDLLPSSS